MKLAIAPELGPECASWLYKEWGHRVPNASLDELTKRFLARANLNELPIAFVAHRDGRPVGTASLIAKEDPSDIYGTWVASVFVPEIHRGNNIARQLIEATENEAAQLGFPKVWLSAAAPKMYEKLGSQLTEQQKHGEPIMMKQLSSVKTQN
ncbi:MAG: GNAT family N-acetyltransferase [Alphaproteobacteria bacterium]|nr:GNAT family N-acetyltransferase [Alphaproteobacteria bacterium]